ncbi:MAG: hypothetical protein WCJ25_00915 [Candidatus Moraniibacteriota bacterium]
MGNKALDLARRYPVWTALFLYTVITLVFTFPLVFRIGSEIPKGGGDVYQVISVIDTKISQLQGMDVVQGTVATLKELNTFTPYVLLGLVSGKITAYTVLFLLTYILSGLGMFLLARRYVKNDAAAFVAGLVFAFAPFHYYQSVAVHLGTMQQQWLPFLILYLAKFFERFRFRYFLATGAFAFLTALSEHQLLAFAMIFIVFFAAYRIGIDRAILRNRTFWFSVAGAALSLCIVAVTMFGGYLKVAVSDHNFLAAGMNAANKYSIKALDPIMPPVSSSIWGGLSAKIQDRLLGGSDRGSYFFGFSVMVAIAYFGYGIWKKRVVEYGERAYRQDLIFWALVTVVFYVLALGASFSIGKFTVYLPYYLIFRFVPFFENIRTTGRIFVFSMLGAAMLSAYALAFLSAKWSKKKALFFAGFSALVLLEFCVAPIPTMTVSYSPFYDMIGRDAESYSLIEIPGSTSYEFASYAMMTDAIHKKDALNGMPLARKISGQFDMQQETPIVKQLLYTIPKGNDPDTKDMTDILKGFDWSQGNDILNYHHVRYITVSKLYADAKVQALAEKFIGNHIACANRYEDSFLTACEIAKTDPKGYYYSLGLKNDAISTMFTGDDGRKFREIGDGAGLKIINMDTASKAVTVRLLLKGAVPGMIFSVAGDAGATTLVLDSNLKEYVFVKTLQSGGNDIPFMIRDASGAPVAISTTKKKHQASLVTDIRVESK